MIETTLGEMETQKLVKFNMRDFLNTLIGANGLVKSPLRIQKFCRKYGLSQGDYEWISLMIRNSRFQVI